MDQGEESLKIIETLKTMKDVEVVFPGHGEKTTLALADTDIKYINDYVEVIKLSKNEKEAAAKIKKQMSRP